MNHSVTLLATSFEPPTTKDFVFGCWGGSFGLFGFNFLAASASAKVVNVITNLAALIYFISSGHVLYSTALPMAAFNVAGALTGSHLAIRRGSAFVRTIFIVIVVALMLRFGWDLIQDM